VTRRNARLKNFFDLYLPLASTWRFYDNSSISGPRLLATGTDTGHLSISDSAAWEQIKKTYSDVQA
jgi:predicted ABC-type ATPase